PDALEVGDGAPELTPRLRVGERLLVGALGQTQRHRGRTQALAVVGAHELLEAVRRPHQELLAPHAAPLEVKRPSGIPRRPMVRSRSPMAKPGVSRSTRSPPMPSAPARALIRQYTR